MSAIIEQEIPTKYIQKKRRKKTLMSDKCRLCKSNVEDIHHIASSCPQLSSRYYLPLRHNVTANILVIIRHNLVIWNKTEKIRTIIEFSCSADINISKKTAEKTGNYGPLIRNLQIM